MPLEDRAAATWEPLVAIADLAGGDWPARARTAATAMTAAEADHEEDTSASVRLLGDLREVFDQADAEALYSTTILEALHQLDEAPWADWYGHPLRPRELASLLRAYGVRPRDVREHGTGPQRKGYARADLHDAWRRYLPPPARPAHPAHDGESAAQRPPRDVSGPEPPADTSGTSRGHVSDGPDPSATGLTSQVTDVPDVSHTPRRVAPGSVWARNGCPQLAPDPDRFTRHDTTSPEDPGR
jgi:Protein of unknown function (DUF3631)